MSETGINSKNFPEESNSNGFSNAEPIKSFLVLYALTGGLYIFYWFYKNLKNFKDHKVLNQNPYLLLWGYLAYFIFWFVGYVLLFALLGDLEAETLAPAIDYPVQLFGNVTEVIFIFLLLRKIKSFMSESLDDSFSLNYVCLLVFLIQAVTMLLPMGIPFYYSIVLLLTFLTGMILSVVQKDLNRYWDKEQGHLAIRISFSKGELIVIGIGIFLWLYVSNFFSGVNDNQQFYVGSPYIKLLAVLSPHLAHPHQLT